MIPFYLLRVYYMSCMYRSLPQTVCSKLNEHLDGFVAMANLEAQRAMDDANESDLTSEDEDEDEDIQSIEEQSVMQDSENEHSMSRTH